MKLLIFDDGPPSTQRSETLGCAAVACGHRVVRCAPEWVVVGTPKRGSGEVLGWRWRWGRAAEICSALQPEVVVLCGMACELAAELPPPRKIVADPGLAPCDLAAVAARADLLLARSVSQRRRMYGWLIQAGRVPGEQELVPLVAEDAAAFAALLGALPGNVPTGRDALFAPPPGFFHPRAGGWVEAAGRREARAIVPGEGVLGVEVPYRAGAGGGLLSLSWRGKVRRIAARPGRAGVMRLSFPWWGGPRPGEEICCVVQGTAGMELLRPANAGYPLGEGAEFALRFDLGEGRSELLSLARRALRLAAGGEWDRVWRAVGRRARKLLRGAGA